MVKTIGLRRSLAREATEEEPPARRRPTASARRRREIRIDHVDEVDEEHVMEQGHVGSPDEGRAEGHDEETMVDEEEGFPGGPHDTSVLSLYADHVAAKVWMGEERPELKLASHGRKVQKFGAPAPEIEGMVVGTGLGPLIQCSLETGDRGLLSAFVERWHKETSSFHLPVGELTITLDDVSALLHLPVKGVFMTYEALDVDEAVDLLVQLLEVTPAEAEAETKQCHGAYVRLSWLRELYATKCTQLEWTVAARAYLLHLIGCTIFANKSATHIGVVFLEAFRDLNEAGEFSWGAAALEHMYDNLNYACQHHGKHLAGYITLLQCWVYEYFPGLASTIADEDYIESQPRACRWKPGKALPVATYRRRLDRLTTDGVSWMPYADHRAFRQAEDVALFSGHIRWGPYIVRYMPDRVLRQFGFIQGIPQLDSCPYPPSAEEVDDMWSHFSDHLVDTGDRATTPGQCDPHYLEWFYTISHPFMSPPQPGEHRVRTPAAHQSVPIPSAVPDVTPTDALHDVMPRHEAGTYQRIAEKLQRMIDLRMVTAGTEAYDIIDDCIKLARGVTDDRLVYVRSRRRGSGQRGH